MDSLLTPERRPLYAIVGAYLVLALLYGALVPPFEASDELWHYPVIDYMAKNGLNLPYQDPQNVGPWKQEGGQPPLYYWIGALATFWVDTGDFAQVWRPNRYVDNGVVTPDGNINLVVHDRTRERVPWYGTVLAVHLVRMLSALMGAGTVICAWLLARELFPERPALWAGTAAFNAFTPMFVFIGGAINNDNLAWFLCGLLIWLIVRGARRPEIVNGRYAALIGLVAGAGMLTKYTTGFLLPLTGVMIAYAAIKRRSWRVFIVGAVVSGGLTIALAGWWYVRNLQLYGDLTGLGVFVEILGRRAIPADLGQLWQEREGFMMSYWGLFGGLNVPMAGWTYAIFNALGVIGFAGLIVFLIRKMSASLSGLRTIWGVRAKIVAFIDTWIGHALALIWPLAVAISLTQWARVTWSSQGRLVFSAITTLSLWLAVGLSAWLPKVLKPWALGLATAYFIAMSAVAPFRWIAPAYALPEPLTPAERAEIAHPLDVTFREPGADSAQLRLLGYELDAPGVLHPGDSVRVTLFWHVEAPMYEEWSIFLHLEDEAGLIAGQRDTYPATGRLMTTDLMPGRSWRGEYVFRVRETAYAPGTLRLNAGLYCEFCPARMITSVGRDHVTLAEIALEPAAEVDYPNPTAINFGAVAELVGYSLVPRRAAPGETLELVLYWRALGQTDRPYTVFSHVLGEGTHLWAGHDAWPGGLSTADWEIGAIIEDRHALALDIETPPGVYEVEIGMYTQLEDGAFSRLHIIMGGGTQLRDFALLSPVRVEEE